MNKLYYTTMGACLMYLLFGMVGILNFSIIAEKFYIVNFIATCIMFYHAILFLDLGFTKYEEYHQIDLQ